jgi:hypothetical protein
VAYEQSAERQITITGISDRCRGLDNSETLIEPATCSILKSDFGGVEGDFGGVEGDFGGVEGDFGGMEGDSGGVEGDSGGFLEWIDGMMQ